MEYIDQAMRKLDESHEAQEEGATISFAEFLVKLRRKPYPLVRNVFQVFHDMVKTGVGEGYDEYPDDPESIHFIAYDFGPLLVDGSDQPFFTDRIFANRLMNMVEAFKGGAQQNKIYIFDGPPGCGAGRARRLRIPLEIGYRASAVIEPQPNPLTPACQSRLGERITAVSLTQPIE